MGVREKLLQGEKVKLWDGFLLDTSIIFNMVLFAGVGASSPYWALACKERPCKMGLYTDHLQLISQSCHIALHDSLISEEKPCEEGNSAVLFIALYLHVISAQSLINSSKVKTAPLWMCRQVCGESKTGKGKQNTEGGDLLSKPLPTQAKKIYMFIACVWVQNQIKDMVL